MTPMTGWIYFAFAGFAANIGPSFQHIADKLDIHRNCKHAQEGSHLVFDKQPDGRSWTDFKIQNGHVDQGLFAIKADHQDRPTGREAQQDCTDKVCIAFCAPLQTGINNIHAHMPLII